jgi:hypothetical protein
MEQENNTPISSGESPATPNDHEQYTLGRRRLLKAIGAAGGALAVSMFLPEKWVKPALEVGYLPAHAQTSPTPTPTPTTNLLRIFNLARVRVEPATSCSSGGGPGQQYRVTFAYESTYGDVQQGTVVHHSYSFPTGVSGAYDIVLNAPSIGGDGFNGTISYLVCTAFGSDVTSTELTTTVSITTAGGRNSNSLSITIPRPPGAVSVEDGGGAGEAVIP